MLKKISYSFIAILVLFNTLQGATISSESTGKPSLTLLPVKDKSEPVQIIIKRSTLGAENNDGSWSITAPKFKIDEEKFPGIIIDFQKLPDRDFYAYTDLIFDLQSDLGSDFSAQVQVETSNGTYAWLPIPPRIIKGKERQQVKLDLSSLYFDRGDIAKISMIHPWPKQDINYTIYNVTVSGDDYASAVANKIENFKAIIAKADLPDLQKTEAVVLLAELEKQNEILKSTPTASELEQTKKLLSRVNRFDANNSDLYYLDFCDPRLAAVDNNVVKEIKSIDGRPMQLRWNEEFNVPGAPNPEHWSYEEGFVRNNESQFYTNNPKNIRIENGYLIIQGHIEENLPVPAGKKPTWGNWPESIRYSSASIVSRDKVTFNRGRIEVRAMLPGHRGSWPAIWMLGNQNPFPACGEIDIMENVGFDPQRVFGTVHMNSLPDTDLLTSYGKDTIIEKPNLIYHVYALEWNDAGVTIMVDNQIYMQYSSAQAFKDSGGVPWPFAGDKPLYMLLNLAIGGAWGGRCGIDEAAFPLNYKVDYIRVYDYVDEKAKDGEEK